MLVNFDNAIIEPAQDDITTIIFTSDNNAGRNYLGFKASASSSSVRFYLNNGTDVTSVTSELTSSVVETTENGFKVVYDGKFSTSGTEFYLGNFRQYTTITYRERFWKISNISFSAGDSFHFQVDVNFNFE